ncbi:MAG: MFS transporter [Candidatus Obscuribacterales bacterium]|nr:MFS transporter [Candidatus Obscuribacterales bacterium]
MSSTLQEVSITNTVQEQAAVSSPWHVLLATWLGGVFDGMDSSMFAIVLYPALSELLGTKSHSIVAVHGSYIVALFMVGWALGAMVFGLLADYIGRARTLTITILLYAVCTGLCATSHNWGELGLYRFLVGAGIGGEMGIGAVMLSEAWPNKSRVQAISIMATSLGFGYLLTAGLNLALGHHGWRWLFVAGIVPAFLTVYIRAKLKESNHFQEIKEKRELVKAKQQEERSDADKELMRFTFWDLFNKENCYKTWVVAALTSSAIIAWWAVLSWIPAWVNQLTGDLAVEQRSLAMFAKDFGMILSGLLGGVLIRKLGYAKCIGSCFAISFCCAVGMFLTTKTFSPILLVWILSLGFFAHVPFVVLWSYIPELFTARIRSTAFGFTYNIGRLLAALAALGSGWLIQAFSGSYAIAASTFASIYLFGVLAAFFMPKTKGYMES